MKKTKQEYEALKAEYIALLEWCTTGDRSGNPYGHDEIKRAIMYLELKKECPAKWCNIYNLKKPLPIIEVG